MRSCSGEMENIRILEGNEKKLKNKVIELENELGEASEKLEKFQNNVDETETNITKLLGEIDEKTQDVVEKKSSIDNKDTTETRLKQVVDMEAKLETARRKAIKDIEFFILATALHVNRSARSILIFSPCEKLSYLNSSLNLDLIVSSNASFNSNPT